MNLPYLIIGNKNYSSWSLRSWLLLKQFNTEFAEQPIELFDASATSVLAAYSPTGKVPVLVMNRDDIETQLCVSDSLAIALYVNDYLTDPINGLDIWSGLSKSEVSFDDFDMQKQRAYCQSVVAEMHSGFFGMRNEIPMNIRATARVNPSEACLADLHRIEDIFEQCLRSRPDNHYLFGQFSLADAFYAPVIFRLNTYANDSGLALRSTTKQYMEVMLNNRHMQSWRADALAETRRIIKDEAGEILGLAGVLANS